MNTQLADQTRAIYDRHAIEYDVARSREFFEAQWMQRFVRHIPEQGHILDLGCGSGAPIGQWLMEQGYNVTGVDFSTAMLEIAQSRWPKGDWRIADMRVLDLPDRFDGIIGWGSFFHLTPDEQRNCLPRLAGHLNPGGALMLTVGHMAGDVSGTVGDSKVYHASLSPAEYASLVEACGMQLTGFLAEDPECGFHSVLLARKDKEPT